MRLMMKLPNYGWINVRLRMDKLPFEWKNACLWKVKRQFMGG